MIRTELDSMPSEMDELNRRIMQLDRRSVLQKETESSPLNTFADLRREPAEPGKCSGGMKAKWEKKERLLPRCVRSGRDRKVNGEIELPR